MPRVRRYEDRKAARRAEVERMAAEALGQSEAGPRVEAVVHVFPDDKPPRYPAVGLHPGAIDGTVPHRCRLVTRG